MREPAYTIKLPPGAFGSGELNRFSVFHTILSEVSLA